MELLPQPGALRSCSQPCNGTKDTAARRKGYTKVAKACLFSSEFLQAQMAGEYTCDRENSEDLAKGNILPRLWKVEKVSDPKTKSFDVMKECSTDILVQVKLSFCMVAKQFNPFLTLHLYARQAG